MPLGDLSEHIVLLIRNNNLSQSGASIWDFHPAVMNKLSMKVVVGIGTEKYNKLVSQM